MTRLNTFDRLGFCSIRTTERHKNNTKFVISHELAARPLLFVIVKTTVIVTVNEKKKPFFWSYRTFSVLAKFRKQNFRAKGWKINVRSVEKSIPAKRSRRLVGWGGGGVPRSIYTFTPRRRPPKGLPRSSGRRYSVWSLSSPHQRRTSCYRYSARATAR